MSDVVIKVENLSKQYRLGAVGTGTLSHDLNRFWAKIRGKEDPYLKIGESNDRSCKGESQYVWALKDINFEVKRGEVLGIIGRNGAGKSTLLKILSQITRPTSGSVKMKGRVGSLLEVGTGFHPDLTGRENVYINGAILGMRKWEIDRKLDEIIDFAGVERYIDTPVKRYSSGMMVRLGFSVAAHLEPEILIVDEVLAVGDAEFQKKCLGKMGEVSKNDGRTILFVSHNLRAIKSLCKRAIFIENGKISQEGNIDNIISRYLTDGALFASYENSTSDDRSKILYCRVNEQENGMVRASDTVSIDICYYLEQDLSGVILACIAYSDMGNMIFSSEANDIFRFDVLGKKGEHRLRILFPRDFFNTKRYRFRISLGDQFLEQNLDSAEFYFDVEKGRSTMKFEHRQMAELLPKFEWKIL